MTEPESPRRASPWTFVPSLNVLQGTTYFVVEAATNTYLSVLELSPKLIGQISSDATLPWMFKALWSPLVDLVGTKRGWILGSAVAVVAALVGLAFACRAEDVVASVSLAATLLAIAAATNDVATDGFYIQALTRREQEAFVGVRGACFRGGRVAVMGGAVSLAGFLAQSRGMSHATAYSFAFGACAGLYALTTLVHAFVLPRPERAIGSGADAATANGTAGESAARAENARASAIPDGATRASATRDGAERKSAPHDTNAPAKRTRLSELREAVGSYFTRPGVVGTLAFILFYRLAELLLSKMISPFLLASHAKGGLAVPADRIGVVYGTIGVLALVVGGILGGVVISRFGLKRCLWPMALAMHVPNLLYAWAAHAQPGLAGTIAVVGVEQFGYGLGFAAYMSVLLAWSRDSRYSTTHYAISTGIMGFTAWAAGRWSGALVEALGYESFFWWVSGLGILGLATLPWAPTGTSGETARDGRR